MENHNIPVHCDFVFEQDERLLIELKDSTIYEGEYCKATNNRIDINNVLAYQKTGNFTSRSHISHILSLYRSEISCICRFKLKEQGKLINKDVFKVIPMSYNDFHISLTLARSYIYLHCIDAKYSKAIIHLRSKETIGVVGLGMESKGKIPINYIVISSVDQIFIFDIFALEKRTFPREIQELLQSKIIQKVVHNCSVFVDFLRKCYKIEMENIFDTAVADLIIQKHSTDVTPDNWRSLSECLSHYFNFPSTLVQDEKLNLDWEQQPLSELCRTQAALSAGYLIKLRNLFEGLLLKSFYDSVNAYSDMWLK